jgi:hypothetical protein
MLWVPKKLPSVRICGLLPLMLLIAAVENFLGTKKDVTLLPCPFHAILETEIKALVDKRIG